MATVDDRQRLELHRQLEATSGCLHSYWVSLHAAPAQDRRTA